LYKCPVQGRLYAGTSLQSSLCVHLPVCLEFSAENMTLGLVQYSTMASRTSNQSWSKGLDAGT